MITLALKWMGRLKEIEFPCTDTELQAKLADLRPPDASPAEIFVSSVEEPTALCMLETQFVNLDEINFLAKRMESFDYDELLQFYAAAQYEGFLYPKDLINLTFNLPRYTVIHDLRNMETVGKAHYMNIHGCTMISKMYPLLCIRRNAGPACVGMIGKRSLNPLWKVRNWMCTERKNARTKRPLPVCRCSPCEARCRPVSAVSLGMRKRTRLRPKAAVRAAVRKMFDPEFAPPRPRKGGSRGKRVKESVP